MIAIWNVVEITSVDIIVIVNAIGTRKIETNIQIIIDCIGTVN